MMPGARTDAVDGEGDGAGAGLGLSLDVLC